MGHISPNFPDKIKEGSANYQETIEKLTSPTTETVSNITNQNDAAEVQQNLHIGGWQCYQQEKKEGIKSWISLDSNSTTDIFG